MKKTKKMKKLHFSVGDGFTDLVRQIFWYEDKYRGYRLLDTMIGITIDQKDAILNGDAYLKPTKDKTGMDLIYEEDKEFKQELTNHKKFLKRQQDEKEKELEELRNKSWEEDIDLEMELGGRRELVKREEFDLKKDEILPPSMLGTIEKKRKASKKAKKHLEKCGEKCKYNHGGRCMFGKRDDWGCWIETEGIEDKLWELLNIRKKEAGLMCGGELSKDHYSLAKKLEEKVFNFIYEKHEYVINDSARNQGECPHCGEKAPTDHFWRPTDKAFIGEKQLGKKQYAYCFECPQCFNNFFYHVEHSIKRGDGADSSHS